MELTKILITAVFSCVIATVVGQYKPEYSLFIKLSCVLFICAVAFTQVADVFDDALLLVDGFKLNNEYIYLLLKAVVIAVVGKIVCDVCVDSGNNAIATCVELICRLALILLAMPLITALSGIAKELIM